MGRGEGGSDIESKTPRGKENRERKNRRGSGSSVHERNVPSRRMYAAPFRQGPECCCKEEPGRSHKVPLHLGPRLAPSRLPDLTALFRLARQTRVTPGTPSVSPLRKMCPPRDGLRVRQSSPDSTQATTCFSTTGTICLCHDLNLSASVLLQDKHVQTLRYVKSVTFTQDTPTSKFRVSH